MLDRTLRPMSAQVIPFPAPPPAARASIRSSIYARGARNFAFHGQLDEYHAPGATFERGATRAAIDAAWLVERVLGQPFKKPDVAWPGVHGARQAALAFQAPGATPAAFQRAGSAFLAERDYALLTDEPGIGKSGQALVAAEARLASAVIPNLRMPVVLILCPALAKYHWRNEVRKWTGHDATVLDGLRPDPDAIWERYVIANYDILYGGRRSDAAGVVHATEHLPGWGQHLSNRFLIGILDEVHMLRGRSSRRAKTVKQVLARVPIVWGLSGTPMPNYVRDLYSIVDIVSGGLFGNSYWGWARAYCDAHQSTYGWKDTGASRIEELTGRLSFFMLGRSAKDVKLELPEKRREVFPVDVQLTASSVAEGNKALSKGQAVGAALRATARAKRSAVVNMAVEALQSRQKVVVFVYLREQADSIAKEIRKHVDCNVMCVSGDLPADGRFAQAQTFRQSSAPACFVATIDSMTVSLSLVGAHLMIFGDLVHEPWKLLQAEKRAHRFDSVERLLVRYIIAKGTIDDAMAANVIAKIPVIEQTLTGEEGSTEAGDLTKMLGGQSSEQILDSLFQSLLAGGE